MHRFRHRPLNCVTGGPKPKYSSNLDRINTIKVENIYNMTASLQTSDNYSNHEFNLYLSSGNNKLCRIEFINQDYLYLVTIHESVDSNPTLLRIYRDCYAGTL